MTEITSMEQYNEVFMRNQKISGLGIEGTTMHMPCPFCAHPDFMVYKIVDTEDKVVEPHVCSNCQRGAKFILNDDGEGTKTLELVQTQGDDPPEWMQPHPRRVEG